MKKNLLISLAILFLVVVGAVVWQAVRQREPVHQGKALSFWLKGFDGGYNDPSKPSYNESVEAVREAGTNALPTLLRMLRTRDSDLKHRLTRLGLRQRLVNIEYVTADRQRWAAREGFVALGLKAKWAIPQLVEISQEESSRTEWHKYATEILNLLKQMWDKDVSGDIAKALQKRGLGATAKPGVK
jgi:hypothetical protein